MVEQASPKEKLTNNKRCRLTGGESSFQRILGSLEKIIFVKKNQGPTADLIHVLS